MKQVNNAQKAILRKQLDYRQKLLTIVSDNLDRIKDLIDRWDNKVYNKRFLTQLQEISKFFRIDSYFNIIIKDFDDRSIQFGDRTYYITRETIHVASIEKDWRDSRPTINASRLKETLDLTLLQYLKNQAEEESAFNRLDEILEQYNKIQADIKQFLDNTPPLFREYTQTEEFSRY